MHFCCEEVAGSDSDPKIRAWLMQQFEMDHLREESFLLFCSEACGNSNYVFHLTVWQDVAFAFKGGQCCKHAGHCPAPLVREECNFLAQSSDFAWMFN